MSKKKRIVSVLLLMGILGVSVPYTHEANSMGVRSRLSSLLSRASSVLGRTRPAITNGKSLEQGRTSSGVVGPIKQMGVQAFLDLKNGDPKNTKIVKHVKQRFGLE